MYIIYSIYRPEIYRELGLHTPIPYFMDWQSC